MWSSLLAVSITLAAAPGADVSSCALESLGSEVEPRVMELLPEISGLGRSFDHVAKVEPQEGGVRIVLLDSDRNRVAERTLPTDGSCEGIARAVAVVVSSWTAELGQGRILAPRFPAPDPPRLGASDAPLLDTPRPWTVELGLLAVASRIPGVGATVRAATPMGPLWGEVSLGALGNRSLALGPGTAGWTRAWAGAGLRARLWDRRSFRVDAQAAGLAGVLQTQGQAFDTDYTRSGWDAGAAVGLTASGGHGMVRPWAGVSGARWFRAHRLRVNGLDEAATLPQTELWLTAGVAFGPG